MIKLPVDSATAQSRIIAGMSLIAANKRLVLYTGDGIHRTTQALLDAGLIVCSECGHITSDSKERCPECKEIIFVIREDYNPPIEYPAFDWPLKVGSKVELMAYDKKGKLRWRYFPVLVRKRVKRRGWIEHAGIKMVANPGTYYFIRGNWWGEGRLKDLMRLT